MVTKYVWTEVKDGPLSRSRKHWAVRLIQASGIPRPASVPDSGRNAWRSWLSGIHRPGPSAPGTVVAVEAVP